MCDVNQVSHKKAEKGGELFCQLKQNCMKWIDPVSEFSLFGFWGELFCQLNQSCLKLHEMDRSSVRIFSSLAPGGGGLFCQLNQNCLKLHEIYRSSVRIFPCLAWGRGELFCQLNQSCLKFHEMDRSNVCQNFSLFGHFRGALLPGSQWDVQWCMKYSSAKLCHVTWRNAEYLTKRQWRGGGGGGFSADLHQVEILPVDYSSLVFITKDQWSLCF